MVANEWDVDKLEEWGMDIMKFDDDFNDDEIIEDEEISQNNNVNINLSMPYYQYEKMEIEFQNFIKKYPNVICKIQN